MAARPFLEPGDRRAAAGMSKSDGRRAGRLAGALPNRRVVPERKCRIATRLRPDCGGAQFGTRTLRAGSPHPGFQHWLSASRAKPRPRALRGGMAGRPISGDRSMRWTVAGEPKGEMPPHAAARGILLAVMLSS